jgi:chromosome segregation ATPase
MKAQVAAKTAEVQQSLRIVELEEANAWLRMELAAAHAKVAELERHEQTLSSDYNGLHKDFNDLRSSHAAVVKEKVDLEKMEREKAQRFQNLLHKKLAELHCDTEESVAALGGRYEDFTVTTCLIGSGRWFRRFLPLLPNAMKISPVSR